MHRQIRWFRIAIVCGVVYPFVGITFAALGNPSAYNEIRVIWRVAAWLVCLATFAFHLWYEHFRLRNSSQTAALHTALAVALGAFLLAIWVNLYGHWVGSSRQSHLAPLALVVFPAMTGVPAFVVSLVLGALLARARGRS